MAEILPELAAFAEQLADAARRETQHWWSVGCTAEDKSGGGAFDPVTDADRDAEAAMRRLIEASIPIMAFAARSMATRAGARPPMAGASIRSTAPAPSSAACRPGRR